MACTLLFAVSHLLLLLLLLFIDECRSCLHFDCNHGGVLLPLPFTYANLTEVECGRCDNPTCQNNHTILNCRPDQVLSISPTDHTIVVKFSDGLFSDGLIKHPCKAYDAIIKVNFPTSHELVNFTFLGDSDLFIGCPNDSVKYLNWGGSHPKYCSNQERILYGPFEYGHSPDSPIPAGCIQFQRLSPDRSFSVQYNMADQCQLWGLCFDVCPKNEINEAQASPNYPPIYPPPDKHLRIIVLSTVIPGFIVVSIILAVYWRRPNTKSGSRILSRAISLPERMVMNGVTIFPYAELQEATNNFDAAKELGEGGFGIVYYGKLRDGREVAVKRMYERNFRQVEQFNNEIRILTSLQHPNLVTLYGCTSRHSRELLLVYEYIPNKTLADHLHGDQALSALLSWPKRMTIAIETATALAFLHFKEVIHRDIKTDNILLDTSFHAKVADFGLSRLFPADVSHVSTAPQGTPGYLDPEYHQCYHLSDKSDVYSFGVVLVELISSLPAVDLGRHRHEVNLSNYAMNKIQGCAFGELVDPKLGFETDFKVRRMTTLVAELAFRCLQLERELRPSMEEVLEELKSLESADYEELEAEEFGYEK